jgi:hypothetical protein
LDGQFIPQDVVKGNGFSTYIPILGKPSKNLATKKNAYIFEYVSV